jgi:ATP-dependent helicase/nuclease subunit A
VSGRRFKRAEELEGAQREAAEAKGNIVVAAGAGSGKTTVLAARYVRLLETGRLESGERVGCRNVLVLTFTRKAAAEMYGRIYGALAEAAELAAAPDRPSDPEPAREPRPAREPGLAAHLAACLSDFSQAQISTFDSFAARIARSAASRFGVAPDFAIDEDRAREEASDLALAFLLERREDAAVRDLVSAIGLEGAREKVFAALAVGRMTISSPPDFAAFHAAQGPLLERMEAEEREKLLALRLAVLEYAGGKTTETSARWLDAMAAAPAPDADAADFDAFAARLADKSLRKPGSNSKDELSRFLSDTVDGIRSTAEGYRVVAATKAAHPSRLGLYLLLDEFRARWDAARRRAGCLSFRDVAQLALDALESDAELRRHYRELYRYAMIDEFQDDNELQKRLLFLLAGDGDDSTRPGLAPDKLFFVGDEKQSIYLFRGADVSVFRRLSGELGAEPIRLARNFRSEPGLIRLVNEIFPSVMAPADPDRGHEDFEASFEELSSREATSGVEPRFVYLELPYGGARGEASGEARDAAECEAWEVARIVRDAVEEGKLLVADRASGRARPARYEDFAILLRSTGKQVHFEKYLRLLGVPYGSENACGLFSEAVACDLYYALRLALYPDDRNALAAYLRSPFAGLSDEAIVRLLLAAGAERGAREPVFDPLGDEARASIPEADRGPHARGAATMAALAARIDRESLSASVSYLWFEAGYRAALLRDPVASAFEEHFELVHSMAVAADERGSCLAAFVAELELLIGEPDKLEVDLPRDGSTGVRIMTIHKSKGLEFPIVIIPQANNTGRDRSAGEAWFWDDESGPTFKTPEVIGERSRNAFFDRSKERREAMEAAELKRLLYVALTRAESHIIVTATESRNADAKGRSFRSLLAGPLGLLEPPSPLCGDEDAGQAAPAAPASSTLGPFGPLVALPSGALVGLIPERGDLEYYRLVDGARAAKGADAPTAARAPHGSRSPVATRADIGRLAAALPVIERRAFAPASTVTAAAERAAAAERGETAPASRRTAEEPRRLDVPPELAAPSGLSPEAWGSLVHAVLESRLSPRPAARSLPSSLLDAVEEATGGREERDRAVARAGRLAEVFLGSELGRRALAARERCVELKIALAAEEDASRNAPRYLKGSIDLAFVEGNSIVVVDYKTDSTIEAGKHDLQLGAYGRAAREIFGRPAEPWVFYLYGAIALPASEDFSST